MTTITDLFHTASFMTYPNAPEDPIPSLPAQFHVDQLRPTWVSPAQWNDCLTLMRVSREDQSEANTVRSVYQHLVWMEDMWAILCDSPPIHTEHAETWMEDIWYHASDDWKRVMTYALTTHIDSGQYYRPSQLFLNREWMAQFEQTKNVIVEPIPSFTFQEDEPLEYDRNREIWFAPGGFDFHQEDSPNSVIDTAGVPQTPPPATTVSDSESDVPVLTVDDLQALDTSHDLESFNSYAENPFGHMNFTSPSPVARRLDFEDLI